MKSPRTLVIEELPDEPKTELVKKKAPKKRNRLPLLLTEGDGSDEVDNSVGNANVPGQGSDVDDEHVLNEVDVDMKDFYEHTDKEVEWIGCSNGFAEIPVECVVEEDFDLDDFDSASDTEELEVVRNKALRELRREHEKQGSVENIEPFFLGKLFSEKDRIRKLVYAHAVATRRQLYIWKNDKERIRVVCRGKCPVFSNPEDGPSESTVKGLKNTEGLTKVEGKWVKKSPHKKGSTSQLTAHGGDFNKNGLTIFHPQLSNLTLEKLNMEWNPLNALNVVAPQLQNLSIIDCGGEHIVSAPNLTSMNPCEAVAHKLVGLLQKFNNVKDLLLSMEIIEAMRAMRDAKLAETLMAEVRVLLDKEKASMKCSNENRMQQPWMKMPPGVSQIQAHMNSYNENRIQQPWMKMPPGVSQIQSHMERRWKYQISQIDQEKAKCKRIFSLLMRIEGLLTQLPVSMKAKLKRRFDSLHAETYTVINRIVDHGKYTMN
ncbi:transposase, MuDR [Artemisia annua]|uniref:Transposase, MuDR n=1 Tax=Artemisia annua TaxID=35608 RepID=A0A2U1PMY4_ARTAN|nr:transposase, MuDR [Artemisia annua]